MKSALVGIGLALIAVAVGCSGKTDGAKQKPVRAVLTSPVIHEGFTLLPCPAHPRTTLDLEGCSEHIIVKSDRQIDARVKRISRLIPARRDRIAFFSGARAWLVYRRGSCEAEASLFTGGSAQPVFFGECEVRRNTEHLADLTKIERILRSR